MQPLSRITQLDLQLSNAKQYTQPFQCVEHVQTHSGQAPYWLRPANVQHRTCTRQQRTELKLYGAVHRKGKTPKPLSSSGRCTVSTRCVYGTARHAGAVYQNKNIFIFIKCCADIPGVCTVLSAVCTARARLVYGGHSARAVHKMP